jgi:hypothetical protein
MLRVTKAADVHPRVLFSSTKSIRNSALELRNLPRPHVGHLLGQSVSRLGAQNRQKADYFTKNAVSIKTQKNVGHLGHGTET